MKEKGFIGNVATLLSGGVIAQVISIAAAPFLTRLYSPESFGVLAGVMSIVSICAVVVHGRYHLAIPVSRNEREAIALLALAVSLSILMTFPVVVVVYALYGLAIDGVDPVYFIALVVVLTIVTALNDAFSYWRSYRQRFRTSARNTVLRAVITTGTQITFSSISAVGLAIGPALGTGVAVISAIRDFRRFDYQGLQRPSFLMLKKVMYSHARFPLYSVPQGLVAAISWNALPLLILKFNGTVWAGIYWLAYRMLMAPVAIFNGAYRQVMLPILGKVDFVEAVRITRIHFVVLYLISGPVAAAVFFFGEIIFAAVFGEKWQMAGVLAGWIVIAITADVAKIPVLCLLQSSGRQRQSFVWEIVIAIVRYAILLPFLLRGEIVTAVLAFSLTGFLAWNVFCVFYLMTNWNRG